MKALNEREESMCMKRNGCPMGYKRENVGNIQEKLPIEIHLLVMMMVDAERLRCECIEVQWMICCCREPKCEWMIVCGMPVVS